MGVSDKRPRDIIGTSAFSDPGKAESELHKMLGVSIRVEEYFHEGQRVLIVHVPAREEGQLLEFRGQFFKREGESLVAMRADEVKQRFSSEGGYDYSAASSNAIFEDLDLASVRAYQMRCSDHSKNPELKNLNSAEFLHNTKLLDGKYVTYAALALFGSEDAIRRYLPNAEICHVYKPSRGQGKAWKRQDFKRGFFSYYDDLWELIDSRNLDQHYQDKFAQHGIPTCDELSVREAIINAITHRDYQTHGSVFVRQYSDGIEFHSPGGFLRGVTIENISSVSKSRNPLLAEAFHRAGLVERAGFGVGFMTSQAIKYGKPFPDFSKSDPYNVRLSLEGNIINRDFIVFIRQFSQEFQQELSLEDYLVLDAVSQGKSIEDPELKSVRKKLLRSGLLKSQGTGKATRYYLADASPSEQPPLTLKDKSRAAVEIGMLKQIASMKSDGVAISSLEEHIPSKTRKQIYTMLRALADDGLIRMEGENRGSVWVATDKGILQAENGF